MRRANEKSMEVLREAESAYVAHKQSRMPIRDYSMKHKVEVIWDLSEEAITERMLKLKIDDYEVILDAEQLRRSIRWV